MSVPLKNRPIIITGASSGIGVGLIETLLSRGFDHLALVYKTHPSELRELLAKYQLSEDKHLYQCDLTDELALKKFKEKYDAFFGSPWGILNMAGSSTSNMSWNISKDEFQNVFENNLLSAFLCTRTFMPDMRKNEEGRILFISSIAGERGIVGAAHYCAAKAGLYGLTKSLAKELSTKNITVNCINLGYFNQGLIKHIPDQIQEEILKQISLNRFSSPHELAGLVEFLFSDQSSYMTGDIINFDGGLK